MPEPGLVERLGQHGERVVALEQLVRPAARVEREPHAQMMARRGSATASAVRSYDRPESDPEERAMATIETDPNLGAQIVADAKEHVLYSWSVQNAINPIAVAGAEGRHFWDYDGKRYLDFASQLVNVNIGHQHPKIIQAIKDQADKLCTIGPPMANESRSAARPHARRGDAGRSLGLVLHERRRRGERERDQAGPHGHRAPQGDRALPLLPRRHPRRRLADRRPAPLGGRARAWPASCARSTRTPTAARPGTPTRARSARARRTSRRSSQYEGAHTVAAIILETVTGTNGVIVPPDGYLQSVREVCDRHGILLILDEVMAGFGRTGKWFACEHWDVVPDILCVAKGINSGYVPLGAMIARGEIVDQVRDRFFPGGLTYAGHPLACASAVASIEAFREEGVVENAAAMGDYFGEALGGLQAKHPSIGDVRGLGCFYGIELVKNRETREMLVPFNASRRGGRARWRGSAKAALERGLYLMTPLERDHGRAAPDGDARGGRGGRRDPRRRPLDRRRVRRLSDATGRA